MEAEFETVAKQYKSMVKQFIKKYKGVCDKYLIDADEIEQLCLIALWKASTGFDPSKGMSFNSFVYSRMDFAIKNRLREVKPVNRNCISLQLLANTDHSGDTPVTLEDTLADDIDIEADIVDREMLKFYEAEIKRVLPKDKADVLINKYIRGYLGIDRYKIWKARRDLIRRSPTFRSEYFKIKNIKIDSARTIFI